MDAREKFRTTRGKRKRKRNKMPRYNFPFWYFLQIAAGEPCGGPARPHLIPPYLECRTSAGRATVARRSSLPVQLAPAVRITSTLDHLPLLRTAPVVDGSLKRTRLKKTEKNCESWIDGQVTNTVPSSCRRHQGKTFAIYFRVEQCDLVVTCR